MKAVAFDAYGPPEVLRIVERGTPRPGPGQVRVRVRACGVQPFDVRVRQGTMDVPVVFPQSLGNEFAGVVDEVGEHTSGWARGDEVFGWAFMASLAAYVAVDTGSVLRKPPDMPWDVAGCMSSSGNTACTALDDLGVRSGETLLVHAAAGGTGTVAVQVARARGARVIGTASEANHAYLAGLGATPLAYGPGLVERVRAVAPGGGVDAVLDAVGGQALRDSLLLAADRSRIATLVDHEAAAELGVIGVRGRRSLDHLRELAGLYAEGRLRITVRARYPLEQIAQAHRDVETGHGRGKVVVVLDRPP
ncbi:NADP-dependent oxidoreductase [Streptomyces boncukensis]|uniref:NADP-dependent oxidoreductase n=1 Tax=Streptomyces boncukensis TaxID=2711219 RepID=A0A6G4WQG4_9ACTN|nr:NADP-dependent oxidoreductase [Streptomyces boncukensis]NGO66880.1 NADP-dependent oxidoreductase [Streptomyces boncukensis]